MKLKVNFIRKLARAKTINEIVFVKSKKVKNNNLTPILKWVLENQLFKDLEIIQREHKNKNYIFINCKKLSLSSDFESIGSKLFDYLEKNKIENSYINFNTIDISNVQLEKTIHGAKLKSYNFDIYKSNNKKNKNINLNIIGKQIAKSNFLRKKLDALLDGVFFY